MDDHYAYFSSYGEKSVNIYAPGDKIISTTRNQNNNFTFGTAQSDYIAHSGSSMATPHVTGVAALLLSINPDLTASELKNIIMCSADTLLVSIDRRKMKILRLNAYKAVQKVKGKDIIITEDTNISEKNFMINNKYIITNGATLSISDVEVRPCPNDEFNENYGFHIINGFMRIVNSNINIGNGLFVVGGDSFVSIDQNSKLSFDNGLIEVSESSLSFSTSNLTMLNSTLRLSERSVISFTNNSEFKTVGVNRISGNTCAIYPIDFSENETLPLDTFYQVINGDRIIISNSRFNLSSETIIFSEAGSKWDGLHFVNCEPNDNMSELMCIVSGNISGIENFIINRSNVIISEASFSNITRLQIINSSQVDIIDSKYFGNQIGIMILCSNVTIDNTEIYDNRSFGVAINYSLRNFNVNNSMIYQNDGSGIEIHGGSIAVIDNTKIFNNGKWGVISANMLPSIIKNGSILANNGYAELTAFATFFPIICPEGVTFVDSVTDTLQHNTDFYLMMAIAPLQNKLIDVRYLTIDKTNPDRFYPCLDFFEFDSTSYNEHEAMYLNIIDSISNLDFESAKAQTELLLYADPISDYSVSAFILLPYILSWGSNENDDFISELINKMRKNPKLEAYVEYVNALMCMLLRRYVYAINLYRDIIYNPPNELIEILAELGLAYATYLQSVEDETNERSVNQTQIINSYNNYTMKRQLIFDRYLNFKPDDHDFESNEAIPDIVNFTVNNYPNPFNPETTIAFTLPNKTDVSIDIYNIKGQKVRTLLQTNLKKGNHKVVWNGLDDHNKNVGSGIYLYRICAGEDKATKKMLLIK